ncbi:hypothetical protein PR202_gb06864 [Eleusine coracana subsp. coracana]|uniref:Uncharacterized protein n=1 Tax=Eleusine coracana subsp. coracana TaxID=191504 RepID=A0AAV5EAR4_ELECO|nr:hypothetical protein PR202_gb06864 [Eleusine coracana subsp. coracana]
MYLLGNATGSNTIGGLSSGQAGTGFRGVHELRQPHGGVRGSPSRVRLGPCGQRPPVPVDRQGRCRTGNVAAFLCGGNGRAVPRDDVVLRHPAVGCFLTHNGWNSTCESLAAGVPMVCWLGFADQHTNCKYVCEVWGVGVRMDAEIKREQVVERVKVSRRQWRERRCEPARRSGRTRLWQLQNPAGRRGTRASWPAWPKR